MQHTMCAQIFAGEEKNAEKGENTFLREVLRAKWMILKSFAILVREFMAIL